MNLSKSSNPVLKESLFYNSITSSSQSTMTVNGTVNKIAFSMVLLVAAAAYTWNLFYNNIENGAALLTPWLIGGAIGGFIIAIITSFKPKWSPYTVPVYAILEGLFLGALSAIMNASFPGIVMQAVGLTFATLFALLFAYRAGIIKASAKFKSGIMAATGGIAIFYVISWVLGMFGVNLSFMHGNGLLSIGISLFIVVIAALNLVLDFDFIEKGAKAKAPKYMEWYGAFGLLVTLIWLYVEILRLLSKLASRD